MSDIQNQSEAAAKDGLLCPTCRIDLVMSDRQGIEIDYCPRCRGVWLDRGELDKIIEKNIQDSAPPSREAAPQFREQGYSSHGDQGKGYGGYNRHGGRHKSFLERIFD